MFDIAWSELLLVAVVAILVVGPKELPGLLRSLGRGLGKLRSTADEFRKHFDDAVRDAGGEDLQREMRALKKHNPLNEVRKSIEDAARDPMGSSKKPAASKASDDDDDYDDLGPPPPPLPPKNAEANGESVKPAQVTESKPAPASPAGTDEADTSAVLVNGAHRAAG
jgi:sec-independent protein translocase protein TatB